MATAAVVVRWDKLTVFQRSYDGPVACVRDRVRDQYRLVVDQLDDVVDLVSSHRGRPLGVDIVGHGDEDGLLSVGHEMILDDLATVRMLEELVDIGVERVRLLGCKIGAWDAAARSLGRLRLGLGDQIELHATNFDLGCHHFTHNGLRASSEATVFEVVPGGGCDEPFLLAEHLAENQLPPPRAATRVTAEQIGALQRHLADDYSACCLERLGIDAHAETLFEFYLPHGDRGGRGRVVRARRAPSAAPRSGSAPSDELFVLAARVEEPEDHRPVRDLPRVVAARAEKPEHHGPVRDLPRVEVAYRVLPGRAEAEAVLALIKDWPR